MEPGASKPKPSGDPSAPMDDAEVERTLTSLESITSTLVQEVGSPPNRAAEAEARAAAVAEQPDPAATTTPPQVENASASPEVLSQSAPAATEPPTQDVPPRSIAAADDQPALAADPSACPVAPIGATQSAPALGADDASTTTAEPTTASAEPRPAASADAEVEQEISQAIQQLQSGQPVAPRATAADAGAAIRPSIPRRILRGLTRAVDAVLAPLSLLAMLLDLPVRWMPAPLKHLLGYVAIGTTLMAGALWYYIVAVRPH